MIGIEMNDINLILSLLQLLLFIFNYILRGASSCNINKLMSNEIVEEDHLNSIFEQQ